MSDEVEEEGDISELQQEKTPKATALAETLIDDLFVGMDPYTLHDAVESTYGGEQERIIALLDTNRQDIIEEMMVNGAAEKILDGLIDLICNVMEITLEDDEDE